MKSTTQLSQCESQNGLSKRRSEQIRLDVPVISQEHGEFWSLYHGDSCEVMEGIPDATIHYSIFSPPFSSLYVYSDSERDMGNCRDDAEFFKHFEFIIQELHRIIMPGRLVSIHCMNLPTTKQHNGVIGIRDFRGDIIDAMTGGESAEIHKARIRFEHRYQDAIADCDEKRMERLSRMLADIHEEISEHKPREGGFVYHSEVCIWKDPVTAMQRTKAIGLLHKQLVKDSCMSRQGIPDYVCTFRKPGDNPEPVSGELTKWIGDDSFVNDGHMSIDVWQRFASPVWMDINQSRTLNFRKARDKDDERHICPLQLDVIDRCLTLWSNPGDVVFSPFAGVASEGTQSVLMGRYFAGSELKSSYFSEGVSNLTEAETKRKQEYLF